MKGSRLAPVAVVLVILLALSAGLSAAQGPAPQGQAGPQAMVGSAFTYQGQLLKDGNPVNDTCEMNFSLYDDESAGNLVGGPITQTVTVANGLFTAPLDFGSDVFTGDARWLEIAVQCTGDVSFNTLAPRQELTAAPYALSLQPGATISGTVGWGNTLAAINSATGLYPAVGVYGESNSGFYGYGVSGYAPASSGWAAGVYGETRSPNGAGVVGYGPSEGVYGRADADSGETYGVYGRADSTDGRGVYGYASSTSGGGSSYGVYGRTDSTSGVAVYGYAATTSGGAIGVSGRSGSPQGRGVIGHAYASSGTTVGVYGYSDSTTGTGVYGEATADSGANIGVSGSVYSPDGYAGYFSTGVGNGVYISAPAGKIGLEVAGGTKNAVVATADGSRLLYSEESSEVWFSDYGFGQLHDGVAVVAIDPLFAQTVNLEEPYHVFLTAEDGYCSLYVTEKTTASFTVRAQEGKSCAIAFDYRLVARRLGYEDTRLERAPWADNDPNLYPEKRTESPSPSVPLWR